MSVELLYQGAEARVFKVPFCIGTSPSFAVCKERFRKTYRHPVLDEKLTAKRVLQEARCLVRCKRAGIPTPTLYLVDVKNSVLYMEYIQGQTMRQLLGNSVSAYFQHESLVKELGEMLAKLHALDLVHGDLTTSNVMVRQDGTLVLLDFGLSSVTAMAEDKAVDLYVLERAFLSTHPDSEDLFSNVLKAYGKASKKSAMVLSKLNEVRLRGRKRTAFG